MVGIHWLDVALLSGLYILSTVTIYLINKIGAAIMAKKNQPSSKKGIRNSDRPNGKAWKKGISPSPEVMETAWAQSKAAKKKQKQQKH